MKKLNVILYFNHNHSFNVGKLFLSEKTGKYHFNYDKSFIGSNLHISPINLKLDSTSFVAQKNENFYHLHGVFADSLPDKWGRKVQDIEFEKIGVFEPTAIDRLAFIGRYGIGALRYEPAQEFPYGKDIVTIADIRKATQKIINGDCEEVTGELLHAGGSAGGMRPKFLIDLDTSDHSSIRYTTGIPEGNFFPVIIKIPGKNGDHYQRLEYLYSQLAKNCGIKIPDTFLIKGIKSKQAFFAIKRFDVLENGDRLHVHTLAGLHGINFSETSLDYSDFLRTTQDITRDHSQVVETYRRMVFNFLSHNKDDHTKNFSFVMDSNGTWSLSPAYDMSYSSGDAGFHSMSLNGIRRNATLKDFGKIAKNFNIKKWKEIIAKTSENLKHFPVLAAKLSLSDKLTRIVNDRIKENIKRVDKDLSFGTEL